MALNEKEVADVTSELLGLWQTEKRKLDRIDRWARWDHDKPHKPRKATKEYQELGERAQAPWGDLVVSSIAQTLYIEGYRRPDAPEDSSGWDHWQANGMDGRQVAITRSALTYGLTYGTCVPGTQELTGRPMPVMRGVSPREMIAVYEDPANDEWPVFALHVATVRKGLELRLYDGENLYRSRVGSVSDTPKAVAVEVHAAGVCPVVRFRNRFDLEGRAVGEIEPYIPLFGRINQTTFDRLVVQRFAAWIVRTISGMSVTESATAAGETTEQTKLRLAVEDFLTAEDPDTKFGSLPATPLDGFIKAADTDKADLAAVTQTPAFELLGQMANLSAEALDAAKDSQTAKSEERKHTLGEDYEQFIRLGSHIAGDADGAADFKAQVRWKDTSLRSIAQVADAFGKLVQMLGFPPEVLWAKVPGMTQQDVDEAKAKAAEGGTMEALLRQLAAGQGPHPELPAAG